MIPGGVAQGEAKFMISIYLVIEVFKASGIVIAGAGLAAIAAIGWLLRPRRNRRETKTTKSFISYRERFEQMKTDAVAKYGPGVEFLRPEMGFDDDPEAFDIAWRDFERDHKNDSRRVADLASQDKSPR